MGIYQKTQSDDSPLALVSKAKSYTMYRRPGVDYWYVNFRAEDRQHRLSTGYSDYDEAKGLVESHRSLGASAEKHLVDDKHLYRMIERARYRNRHKSIPFDLSIDLLRSIVARCKGCCEVTGHPLEDTGPFRPSLDRIESKLGYVPGNVRIVCLITNTAMLHYGQAAFAELAISFCQNRGLLTSASM